MKYRGIGDLPRNQRLLLIIAIVIAAFNMRPALTSVGPLLGDIQAGLSLSHWSAGLITSLPILAFAAVSPFAAGIGNRLGNMGALLVGLVLLFAGIGLRSIAFISTLYAGTVLVGIGIALINVLLPAIIKGKYPNKVGAMTSVYTTAMAVFAAIAAGISVPIADGLGIGWEWSLFSWAGIAVFGILIWIFVIREEKKAPTAALELDTPGGGSLWHSAIAWQVTMYMGLQSFAFYTVVSWLPAILQDYGFSASTAGWLLSYSQFASLPITFLAPILAERFSNQQGIAAIAASFYTIGFAGLAFGGPPALLIVWVTCVGLASGGTISLSLAFIAMRARDARQAGVLSGMAQSVGYVFGAIGPLLFGLLYDLTGHWKTPLLIAVVVGFGMIASGIGAGRNKYVESREPKHSGM